MKISRMFLALAAVAALAGLAYVQQSTEPSALKMTAAATDFLAALDGDAKTKATFAFDDKERVNWHFTPQQDKDKKSTRKGLPIEQMTEKQKAAAMALLQTGTSATGFKQATIIMSLEGILHDLEKNGGTMVRNPGWYFFSIFGTPSKTGRWGWRVEGHHLALNFTVDKGVVEAAPGFFGCNPADVKDGDQKGLRVLADVEDLGRELFESLDADQKKVALQDKQYAEIQEGQPAPKPGEPRGVSADKLTAKQKAILDKLLIAYAQRWPADVAEKELGVAKKAAPETVYFGWAGETAVGKPHSYRVQGPTFVVEFLNVQEDAAKNPANHIHSGWRSIKHDFGAME